MGQVQHCYVCGQIGIFVEMAIQIGAHQNPDDLPLMIGQCLRCHRFICSRHGELLEPPSPRRWFSWLLMRFRPAQSRIVCCPFDPDVPLGQEADALPSPLALLGLTDRT